MEGTRHMAKSSTPNPDQIAASGPRPTMGTAPATGFRNASAETGKQAVRPKAPGGTADGSIVTGNARPAPIMAERLGARYRTVVGIPAPMDPVAGATMANARTLPSAINRSRPDFVDAASEMG